MSKKEYNPTNVLILLESKIEEFMKATSPAAYNEDVAIESVVKLVGAYTSLLDTVLGYAHAEDEKDGSLDS